MSVSVIEIEVVDRVREALAGLTDIPEEQRVLAERIAKDFVALSIRSTMGEDVSLEWPHVISQVSGLTEVVANRTKDVVKDTLEAIAKKLVEFAGAFAAGFVKGVVADAEKELRGIRDLLDRA